MPQLSSYSVIFDADVLQWIVERFQKKYPLEAGVFLFGEHWTHSRYNIPYITQASEPTGSSGTKDNFYFSHSEVLRQTRLAAADGRMLLGWSHSHPWKAPILGINMQSIIDAKLQIEYRFTTSLIIGIWETGWWCNAWKEGFAAPVPILVNTKKNQLLTLKKWYYQNWGCRPWYFK